MIREIRRERRHTEPLSLSSAKAGHSALLLLNWQPDTLARDGALHLKAREADINVADFDAAAAKAIHRLTRHVLPACRTSNIDIIHIPTTYWRGSAEYRDEDRHTFTALPILEGRAGLSAQPDELTVVSTSVSPFNSTRLDLILRNMEIEQLLMAGLLTNGSIELAAQDARDRGYEVIVIEDACVALTADLHRAAIGRIRTSTIATAKADTITEHLRTGNAWPPAVTNQATETHPIFAPDLEPKLFARHEADFNPFALALVTVDMQYLNAHPDWGVGRELKRLGSTLMDDYFASVKSILPAVRAVQEMFRKANLPLLHLRTACLHSDERDSGRHRRRNRDPMAALGARETEFLPEVAPDDGEIVVNKTSWGVFNSTEIEGILRRLSISHLVIVGVVTNGCVELAARDALDRGFRVTIVKDATTTRSPDLHFDALYRLENHGAIIQESTSLLTCLSPHFEATLKATGSTTITV